MVAFLSSPPAASRPAASSTAPVICMLCPGGIEHAGGIGRWAGYLQEAWQQADCVPPLRIIDTRGLGGLWVGIVTFACAMVEILRLGLSGRLALIHANISIRGSTARKYLICHLARLLDVPVVLHLHGSGYDEFYRGLPRWIRHSVARIFVTSQSVVVLGDVWRDFLVRELNVPFGKIAKIINAVPIPHLPRTRPMDDRCHILMLGRLGARKGVPELLDALATPALRAKPWRTTIAGDGEVEEYRARAADLGLGDRIAFPGWVAADVAAELLANADILVLPSYQENLPVAVLEAMSYGVAVVTTAVGATPEIIEDGVSGLFVPVGDSAALARALGLLIDEPQLRLRIGDAGRRVFEERLDIGIAVRRFSMLYRDILDAWADRRRRPRRAVG